MLGLKRNTVKVVPHHPGWLKAGKETCTILQQAAGDYVLDVQHAGSTSIPNLPSKPIIDIVVPVQSFDVIPDLFNKFTKVGFIYRGHFGGSMGHVFVKESAPNTVTTIVHVLEDSSGLVEQYTLFRDALLENKGLVEQYARLKEKLMKQFPGSQKMYTKGKKEFIDIIVEKRRQTV